MVEGKAALSADDKKLRFWLANLQSENQNPSYSRPQSNNLLWVFWSHQTSSGMPESVLDKIKSALECLKLYIVRDSPILIQFWAPMILEDRCYLTTSAQPFAVTRLDEEFFWYRKHCLNYKFSETKEGVELPGRVFYQKLPELTPNVMLYSIKEYPLQNHARCFNIQGSLCLPVFEESSANQCCAGVLELLRISSTYSNFIQQVCRALEEVGLKAYGTYNHFFQEKEVCDEGLRNAIREINKGMKVVGETHDLPLSQTWVLCSHFNAVAYGNSNPEKCSNIRCEGEDISTLLPSACYLTEDQFQEFTKGLHLQKGQGVVGRAYMSHNSCFCADVTQFSLTDYPFAHSARECSLTSCFAICLRSGYTGDLDYVLEFFLPPIDTDYGRGDRRTLLNSLLETMKENLPSFKVASGKELGEELDVEFLNFERVMLVDFFKLCQTAVRSPSRGEMAHLQSSDPPLIAEDDAIKNQSNIVGEEQIEGAVMNSEKKRKLKITEIKNRITISYEDLKQYFGRKLAIAAESLGVSRSTLKRICREQHGINRWPCHKRNKNNHALFKRNPPCSGYDPLPNQVAHDTAIQDVSTVKIKAEYKCKKIKFELSSSSRMVELEEKVSERFKLNVGTFTMEYIDDEEEEEEWFLIGCNEDLQKLITDSISRGNTTIKMMVQPITD